MIAVRLIGLVASFALWAVGVIVFVNGDAFAGGALLLLGTLLGVACVFRRDRGERMIDTIIGFFSNMP
jgi:hypothetical protein